MKTILTIILLCIYSISFGQYYEKIKQVFINDGFSINAEYGYKLSQGNGFYNEVTLKKGIKYMIVACTDDKDINDIDILLCDLNGNILDKDTDISNLATIILTPIENTTYKIIVKNYSSNTPTYKSMCYLFIVNK